MDWKVGDVALCITPGSRMENMEVVIMSPAIPKPGKVDLVHIVDPGMPIPEGIGPYINWGAERRHLVPLQDPNLPSTWEECVFKPQELVGIE